MIDGAAPPQSPPQLEWMKALAFECAHIPFVFVLPHQDEPNRLTGEPLTGIQVLLDRSPTRSVICSLACSLTRQLIT